MGSVPQLTEDSIFLRDTLALYLCFIWERLRLQDRTRQTHQLLHYKLGFGHRLSSLYRNNYLRHDGFPRSLDKDVDR